MTLEFKRKTRKIKPVRALKKPEFRKYLSRLIFLGTSHLELNLSDLLLNSHFRTNVIRLPARVKLCRSNF